MNWLIMAAAIASNAGANILMKAGVRSLDLSAGGWPVALKAALNPYLLMGLASFGVAFAAYAYTLTRFPLSVAYPVMTSLALIVVSLASVLQFQETFPLSRLIGTVLILAGVILVARTA